MKNVFFLLMFCFVFTAWGQHDEAHVDELTQEFKQKLTDRGVSSYFSAKRYCSGRIEMFKIGDTMCTSKGTYYEVYMIWQEEGQAFLKKIDNCGLYYSVELEDGSIYDNFISQVSDLIIEEVKHYKSESYTGKPALRKKAEPCFRKYQFTYGENSFSKSYNLFDISNASDGRNLNYDHNQSLKVVKLDAKLDELLAKYEVGMRRQLK